ncbi:MAG: hypothetical protein V3T21_03265 [Candidatus Margulisiibacteriota bacterium]
MKNKYILTALMLTLLFASISFAMGTAPGPKIKTGDKALDKALMEIDKLGAKPAGKKEIEGVLMGKFSVTKKEINLLRKRGYSLTEVYYLSLLAKQSGKKVNGVAALHAKGGGWGVLAKRLKVHPGDLNRLRVRLHKIRKEAVKEQKREQKQKRFKIHAPKEPKGGKGKKK